MNKYLLLLTPVIFLLICSCDNNNQEKNNPLNDTLAHRDSTIRKDSAALDTAVNKPGTATPGTHTPSFSPGPAVKTDDFIKQYPGNDKAALRNYIESLRKEWQHVPNPFTATYEGNDFGDYFHLLFKDAKGVTYDFGQAANNFDTYKLYEPSGQYEDNPEYLGKKFKVYWEWKLTDFLCCEGEYGKAKAYLPAIIKLELVKQ